MCYHIISGHHIIKSHNTDLPILEHIIRSKHIYVKCIFSSPIIFFDDAKEKKECISLH
jgi:hypothetical protein